MKEELHQWFIRHLGPGVGDRGDGVWKGFFAGKASMQQIMFVRDDITYMMKKPGEPPPSAFVVGEHTSKSCLLPVYEIPVEVGSHANVVVVARGNFHDWKVSVEADRTVRWVPGFEPGNKRMNAKDEAQSLAPCYFEGFPEDRIYPGYSPERLNWSAELPYSEFSLQNFLWVLKRTLEHT